MPSDKQIDLVLNLDTITSASDRRKSMALLCAEILQLFHVCDFVSWIVFFSCGGYLKYLEANSVISKRTPQCCFGISKPVFIIFYQKIFTFICTKLKLLGFCVSVTQFVSQSLLWHLMACVTSNPVVLLQGTVCPDLRQVKRDLITGFRAGVRNSSCPSAAGE